MIHQALGYQYLEAWYHILHLIALLFQVISIFCFLPFCQCCTIQRSLILQVTGKARSPQLIEILKSLAELRDSYNFASKNDAEYAIGAAIRVLGPETVLNLIPLKASNSI